MSQQTLVTRPHTAMTAPPDGGWIYTDDRPDPAVETVSCALDRGLCRQARGRFLKLAESAQVHVLMAIASNDAVRLAASLPPFTIARIITRLPKPLGRDIMGYLPAGKRETVLVNLDHRRSDGMPRPATEGHRLRHPERMSGANEASGRIAPSGR